MIKTDSLSNLFPTQCLLVPCILSSQKINSHVVTQMEDSTLITNWVHVTFIDFNWWSMKNSNSPIEDCTESSIGWRSKLNSQLLNSIGGFFIDHQFRMSPCILSSSQEMTPHVVRHRENFCCTFILKVMQTGSLSRVCRAKMLWQAFGHLKTLTPWDRLFLMPTRSFWRIVTYSKATTRKWWYS